MIDGLWSVQFQGPQGHGGGAVVLTGGKVYGGDSGFTYAGSYELNGDAFKAKVTVKNFDPSFSSVFGSTGSFELVLEGKVQGDLIVGTGALVSAPTAKMSIRLTKRGGL